MPNVENIIQNMARKAIVNVFYQKGIFDTIALLKEMADDTKLCADRCTDQHQKSFLLVEARAKRENAATLRGFFEGVKGGTL